MIGNSVVSDEGTYSFDQGDVVASRFDILSELDFVFKRRYGFRISAAGWLDMAYDGDSRSNPNPPLSNIPSYVDKKYSPYTNRYYQGPAGEILDAFVFGKFEVGPVPTALKAGRHTVFWGESLYVNGALHGVSYAQMPLDLQKGFATPGTEAKELFRPLGQLSGQAQLTETFSVAAQYFWQWESYRYPEGGTYLGPLDFVFNGPDREFLSPALGFAARGNPVEPGQSGEWGVSARWSPEVLDGTLGLYYRHYSDKLPQVLLTAVGPNRSQYNLIYADDIDLFGLSLAKNVGGVSVGMELSYRHNTPLNSQVLGVSPTGLPSPGDTPGARGDTYHGLINATGLLARTRLFDAASWGAELTWSHWSEVTSGQNLFYALGFPPCSGRDKWDGCTTRDYFGLAFAFTPTWFQVFPGVDLSAPITYAVGLSGNAATVFAWQRGRRQLQRRRCSGHLSEVSRRFEIHRLLRPLP